MLVRSTKLRRFQSLKALGIGAIISFSLLGLGGYESDAMLGDDHGLTDLRGRELVPAVYPAIFYIGHGLFLLRQRTSNPAERLDKILINRNGIKLKPEVPHGATFEKVLWLGEHAESDKDFVPDRLAEDALLVFESNEHFGVCDKAGNVVLPANFTGIGDLREGTAIVQDNDRLFLFDTKKREQRKIDYAEANRGTFIAGFSEGLAPFKNGRLWGYMDKRGNVVIEPKYNWANIFRDGQAFVSLLSPDGKSTTGVIINKSGEVISPPELNVSDFYGDYAVTAVGSGNSGVVNRRDFKYVIKPEFKAIIPQAAPYYSVDDAWSLQSKPPLFYYAVKNDGEPPVVLSVKGDVLFELPKELHFPNWPPRFENGAIACPVGAEDPWSKIVYLNLQGHEVPAPSRNLAGSKSVTFREIAPGVLLKTITLSDDLHNQADQNSKTTVR